eukprot:TRINITY_DN63502_c0_g1_i1.p1 TRINITY_DN63502_c0_g1~~TRINITY_DN63502_c0_g1_i1.p1  ORF type:complete len:366 (+),score=30.29 TRINITY_DN63502_c0_g1_i1:64-1098(+)
MFNSYVIEAGAFILLCFDVRKGCAGGFSARTVAALTFNVALCFFNLPHTPAERLKHQAYIGACVISGTLGSYLISRQNTACDDDDLCSKQLPRWLRESAIYLVSLALSVFAVFAACHFSYAETLAYASLEPRGPLCAFLNFSNAMALLPQLVLCRRRGAVPPSVVKFLLIIGCKQAYEFMSDVFVSYANYQAGKFSTHELCFMSGDLIAAVLLMDLYYMVASSKAILPLCFGKAELPLSLEDESDQRGIASTAQHLRLTTNAAHQRVVRFIKVPSGFAAWTLVASIVLLGIVVSFSVIDKVLGVQLVVIISLTLSMYDAVASRIPHIAFAGTPEKPAKAEKLCV